MALTKNKKDPFKAYNIVVLDDGSVEIDMYGEVVASRPKSWWSGEEIPGNFISLDEFLKDLEEIKDKNKITIHINSPGGDLYAGLAIYNRLKAIKGEVITINDGLAASAASVIFQAGNTRQVNTGSNTMIHGASTILYGWYNLLDLKKAIKEFEAHDKAIANVYVEKSGKTLEDVKEMLEAETWLTGQEAVDAGLADEVIGLEPVEIGITADKTQIVVNGLRIPTNRLTSIPNGVPVMNSLPSFGQLEGEAEIKPENNQTGGKEDMDPKTVEELKNAFPNLVLQVENSAKQEGAQEERVRIESIESIQNMIADPDLIKNAKFGEAQMTAEQLSFKAMQNQAKIGGSVVNALEEDGKETNKVGATPNNGGEEGASAEEEVGEVVDIYNRMKKGGTK